MPIPRHHFWILKDLFLAGQHPQPLESALPSAELTELLELGIQTFIDLTELDEMPAYGHLVPNACCVRYPVPNATVPGCQEEMIRILDRIDASLERRQPVYLHCQGGRGRTGTVAGCWLARQGATGQQAYEKLQELWAPSDKGQRGYPCPETPEQINLILQWKEPPRKIRSVS